MWIDSHAHVDEREGEDGYAATLARAAAAGVRGVLAVGGTERMNAAALAAADEFPGQVRAALGYDRDLAVALTDSDAALADATARLRTAVASQRGRVGAIGETGLDYYYGPDTAVAQQRLFAAQVRLARAEHLPVVIHSREADDDTLRILRDAGGGDPPVAGVLHCFTGSLDFAGRVLALGLHISFSGIVTFRNADPLRAVARAVPLDRLLLETDAPYLAPVPLRGRRNEPAFLPHVAAVVARERGLSVAALADATAANAARLFGFDPPR